MAKPASPRDPAQPGPCRLDADVLYGALTLLAADGQEQPDRDRAARVLLGQLRVFSARRVVTRFAEASAFRRSGDIADAIEDAIQHVALVASTGSSRFRGSHPSEAVAWCQRIFVNFLTSESRRRARTALRMPDEQRATLLMASHLEGVAWRHAGQETALSLRGLCSEVWRHLQRTRPPSVCNSLYRAVRRYLEEVWGQAAHERPPRPRKACSRAARRAR
ncbi:MAG TPA: hypothetical protein VG963_17795, partial [Polyangiaceae bacterium]|nr:hypothetical protein [Polyangiaceae bacterium]